MQPPPIPTRGVHSAKTVNYAVQFTFKPDRGATGTISNKNLSNSVLWPNYKPLKVLRHHRKTSTQSKQKRNEKQ